MAAVMTVTGQAPQMGLQEAIDLIHNTPPSDRSAFASQIWRRRRARYGPRGRAEGALERVPF
jgi:hypothetical protein